MQNSFFGCGYATLGSMQARRLRLQRPKFAAQYRQPHGYRRPFAELTFYVDFAAVQIDAALDDHQTKARAWTVTDVLRAMEGGEEPLSIGFWNADTLVSDSANDFGFGKPDFETYHSAGAGILDRVG